MDKFKFLQYFDNFFSMDLFCHECLESTNDTAKVEAARNPNRDVIITAQTQSAGRGRLGRSFSSQPGGIYMSVSHRPRAEVSECMHFTLLAALAVADAIYTLTEIKCEIKWPNDILINGQKICGILTEAVHFGKSFFIVTGIGINITNAPPPGINAARLADFSDTLPEIEELAALVARKLYENYDCAFSQKERLLAAYRKSCHTLGQNIISKSNGTIIGIAIDIDENGALIIRGENGETIVKTVDEI